MRQCEGIVKRQAFEAAIRGEEAVSPYSVLNLDQVKRVKQRSNSGQTAVKRRTNSGQIVVK